MHRSTFHNISRFGINTYEVVDVSSPDCSSGTVRQALPQLKWHVHFNPPAGSMLHTTDNLLPTTMFVLPGHSTCQLILGTRLIA
jgi:hypothetical protein